MLGRAGGERGAVGRPCFLLLLLLLLADDASTLRELVLLDVLGCCSVGLSVVQGRGERGKENARLAGGPGACEDLSKPQAGWCKRAAYLQTGRIDSYDVARSSREKRIRKQRALASRTSGNRHDRNFNDNEKTTKTQPLVTKVSQSHSLSCHIREYQTSPMDLRRRWPIEAKAYSSPETAVPSVTDPAFCCVLGVRSQQCISLTVLRVYYGLVVSQSRGRQLQSNLARSKSLTLEPLGFPSPPKSGKVRLEIYLSPPVSEPPVLIL